jgi:hypothetical protein
MAETGPVSERLRVREIDDDEGRRLVRIIRRGSGSVVTWRRAQMVLLSAQGMDTAAIATHGVNLGHVLLVPEAVSSQLAMPPLRMPKMSLLPKSRSPAEIFGRSTLSGLIEALA